MSDYDTTDIWGRPRQSSWWNQDVGDAGQALYNDPMTALQAATLPNQLVSPNQADQEAARAERGGFMSQMLDGLKTMGGAVDGVLNNVLGKEIWGGTKNVAGTVGSTLWYPVDKVASGLYWLYSEAISQPLSTLIIQAGKSEYDSWDNAVSWDEWVDAYHQAEHISPGQASMNNKLTQEALGKSGEFTLNMTPMDIPQIIATKVLGDKPSLGSTTQAERDEIKRNTERFLYDSDFWRSKEGWKYTVGTGTMDLVTSMMVDPGYAGISAVSKGIKGARAIKLTTAGVEAARGGGVSRVAGEKLGSALSPAAKTPEQAVNTTKMQQFFDWADGKSAAEIAQHPIFGPGRRRKNAAADEIGEILALTPRNSMEDVMRFAAGDTSSLPGMIANSDVAVAALGKAQDNRVLIDSVRFNKDILSYFLKEEQAGRVAASAGGTSKGVTKAGILVEAPGPKPVGGTPQQIAGWEATYGQIEAKAQFYREAAKALNATGNVKVLSGAKMAGRADIAKARAWTAAKKAQMNSDIATLGRTNEAYAQALGSINRNIDEFRPSESNIFGTVSEYYRMGPLALKGPETIGNKAVAKFARGRGDKVSGGGGIAMRTVRGGFFTPAVRFVSSFGQRLPGGFVDHNATDASQRVMDMLKQVRGMTPDHRLALMRKYDMAGDKVARSKALQDINSEVITHLASNANNLDPIIGAKLATLIENGIGKTMDDLKGVKIPAATTGRAQRFTAATDENGRYLDHIDDEGGMIVAPHMKAQLSTSDVLLPVRELDRIIGRHSGFWRGQRLGGAKAQDMITDVLDGISGVWKASTLLRPGYTIRSMSEEQVASAIKFGIFATLADAGHGGLDLIKNTGLRINAYVGSGSFVPSTGKGAESVFARIRLTDPEIIAKANARADEIKLKAAAETNPLKKAEILKDLEATKVTKVKVGSAYPIAMGRISQEVEHIAENRKVYARLEAKLNKLTQKPSLTPAQQAKVQDLQNDLAELDKRKLDHEDVIEEFSDYADEIMKVAVDAQGRRLGEGYQVINGIKVPEYFSREWNNVIPRDQITSAHATGAIFARSEAVDRGRIIRTGDWVSVDKKKPHHMESWLRALNLQAGQDPLYRLVLEDSTLAKARAWLKTPQGKAHRAILGPFGRDSERLLKTVEGTLDQYLPESTGLRQKLLDGDMITESDLRKAIREEDFPNVHGEDLKETISDGSWKSANNALDRMIESGFNRLGTIPNDIMARQPIFLRAYQARMTQFLRQEVEVTGKAKDSFTLEELEKVRDKAAKFAKKDISTVVYDPERTNATQALRFFAPFLSAHVDGLQRWAGLIAERPEFVNTASKIYNAPVAANLVTDQYGNHVDQDGYATIVDPVSGKTLGRHFVGIEDRIITFQMPWATKKVKGVGKVPGGGVPIKISAMNTILPGDPWFNPGAGPYVQMTGSMLAKEVPAAGDFLQWAKIMPYGASDNSIVDPFTPKYMRDAWDAFTADSTGNEKYQAAYLAAWKRQEGEHANGGPPPDMKKVASEAREFMFLDALTSWASPVQTESSPLSGSPFQFFQDQYKIMQQIDPENAKDAFLQKYGADYFAYTASLSDSMGIAATISADETAEKYGDLIAEDPDMAGLVVGDVYNKGEFSMSVYRKQMDQLIGGKRVREKLSAQDAIKENEKALGWEQWRKFSNGLDAMLVRSGFSAYGQAGTEAFTAKKKEFIQALGAQYPAWMEDFGEVQTQRIPIRISSMRKILADDKLMKDPMRSDLRALKVYLDGRDQLKQELAARGGSALQTDPLGRPTGQYSDIGYRFNMLAAMLVNSNTEFGDIYHRYLENDDLS